jgi:ribosomal protein S18 acetylase RimI-like enzyme
VRLAEDSLRIEPLSAMHDRTAFDCGNEHLNRYLRTLASQDVRRRVARVFVAVMPVEPSRIVGFFTLSAAWIAASDLPPETAKRLPRHPVPAAPIGRLAVDRSFARRGFGSILLADAVKKTITAAEAVAITVVVVDPIDETARAFYQAFGFRSLLGPKPHMFLALPRAD